ncbi:MAG: ABC transporter substrate-binding protein [Gemmatimonadales bacterium]
MRRSLAALALLVAACGGTPGSCPVVAFAGATPHSVDGRVTAALLATDPGGRRVCIAVFRHPYYDSLGDPAAEVAMAERVVAQDDVMVVVGHVSSEGSLAVAPVYRAAGIAQLVPAATSERLARFGPSLMSLVPDDSLEGLALAAYGDSALRARSALVVYRADEYGEEMFAGLRAGLARRGVRITAAFPSLAESDLPTLVNAAVRRGPADVAYLLGDYRVVGRAALALHALRPAMPLIAGDAAAYPEGLTEQAGAALPSIRLLTFRTTLGDSARTSAYRRKFRALAGRDPTPDELLTTDALLVAVAAVREAGPDRSAVESWLASLGASRPPWPGLSGPIQFAHRSQAGFDVMRVQDGALVPVTPR